MRVSIKCDEWNELYSFDVKVESEDDLKILIEFVKNGVNAYEDYKAESKINAYNELADLICGDKDNVNTPTHYKPHGIIKNEPINTIKYMISDDAYKGFLVGNIIKYVSRYDMKNGVEDLEKAKKYIDMLENEYRK